MVWGLNISFKPILHFNSNKKLAALPVFLFFSLPLVRQTLIIK